MGKRNLKAIIKMVGTMEISKVGMKMEIFKRELF